MTANLERGLCVGGPRDHEMEAAPEYISHIEALELLDAPSTIAELANTDPGTPVRFRRSIYLRETLACGRGHRVIWRHESLTLEEALDRVLEFYAKPGETR